MRYRSLLLITVLLAGCTAAHYESPHFAETTRTHQTIAVLPFEMIFLGKVPRGLTPEMIDEIEEAESLAFQRELYQRLLHHSSVHRRRPIMIRIQPAEATNEELRRRGIGIRQSWEMPAAELAALLDVDAVVRTSVQKTRYLSVPASVGIEVGLQVLQGSTEGEIGPWLPWGLKKTYDIWADSELVSRSDGEVLWRVSVQRSTDWHRPANDVVAGITGKLAKKFPYRA